MCIRDRWYQRRVHGKSTLLFSHQKQKQNKIMQKSNSALIIVDVQNDFMEKGSLEAPKANSILPYINNLRKKFQTIFITQDYHPKQHISFAETHNVQPFSVVKTENGELNVFPSHCVQGTWGCEFHKDLERADSDIIIQKGIYQDIDSFSGFGTAPETTKLNELLKQKSIEKVFIVGICLDYCVRDTAVDAANLGYSSYVVKEGTVALSDKGGKDTIELLEAKNVKYISCLLYTSPSPRDRQKSRMPSSA
eukprot:TRINITY_DN13744_c0_g1_i1.p1 TRINITY_DN13744_c0_g1~~TRINITY_DN13744_c0_g1_i1.p1  ORF type:complete len:250 (+),score=49.01 TRINITY_DN13744_c0_g1_i1:115-864(+)